MIYNYKTEGISLKDFSNYQNPIELFQDLRDDNINPKKVLKDQINFKLDLSEIKKRKSKIKIKRSNIENFFDLTKKIIDFFRDYSVLLSEAKYKANHERGLEI